MHFKQEVTPGSSSSEELYIGGNDFYTIVELYHSSSKNDFFCRFEFFNSDTAPKTTMLPRKIIINLEMKKKYHLRPLKKLFLYRIQIRKNWPIL